MPTQYSKKHMIKLFICGIIGTLFMMSSDWLMIYGDVSYSGKLAWLTYGVSQISARRNAIALGLGFVAVIFYVIALLGLVHYIKEYNQKKTYTILTTIGMTPWLCIHLLYVMILFLFQWMHTQAEVALAFQSCEALFAQFSWVIIIGEVFMLLPFVYWFMMVLKNQTYLPKTYAINNPIFLYIILKLISMVIVDCPARLAFVNGLMSEAMFIWFVIFLSREKRIKD